MPTKIVSYSIQREVSDGTLSRIVLRIEYEDKESISVYVDDTLLDGTGKYTWTWDGDDIVITPNVEEGSEVLIRRLTAIDKMLHSFESGAVFNNQSMDENFRQLLHIAQEYSEGSGITDVFSDIDMHGYKIKNVGFATEDGDVVTFKQYREDALGASVARDQAQQYAQDALRYRNETEGLANQALTDVEEAKDSAIQEIQNRIAPTLEEAKVYATEAKASAGTAVKASKRAEEALGNTLVLEDSAKTSAEASEASRQASETIYRELKEGLDTVQDVAEPIKIVASNIHHVQTTSTNINDVNIVGADLEGGLATDMFQDYGDLDNPGAPGTSIIGGNIKNVSDNIQHVRVDSENIEAIKTVAGAIDNLPEISATLGDAVKKAESARDTAQAQATVATAQANIAKEQVPLVQAEGTKQVQRVTAEGDKQVKRVQDAGATAVQNVENASTQKITDAQTTAVNAVKAQQTTSVNAVVAQGTTSTNAVKAEGTKQVQAVTNEGTSQLEMVSDAGTSEVQKVTAEGTKQVSLAKAQVTIATQKAQEASTSATNAKNYADTIQASVDSAEASATEAHTSETKADTYAKNASASASTATAQATVATTKAQEAKTSADTSALHKDSAQASATEATKQAERAKQYADQMATGQVQADWNETDPSSKACILNKPTLGALASKDSISYTEITGAPPQPDLSGLATKNELQTGLASKANTKHTHSITEVTNLQTTLDAKADQATVDRDLQAVNTQLGTKAVKADVDTALAKKLDITVFNGFIDYGDLG